MLETLRDMADSYRKKKPEDLNGKIHILIDDENGYTVELKEDSVEVEASRTELEGDLGLVMTKDTFDKLASGEWNGMTAAGRSTMSESAPFDFRVPDSSELEGDTLQMMYHLLTHFFSTEYRIALKHLEIGQVPLSQTW